MGLSLSRKVGETLVFEVGRFRATLVLQESTASRLRFRLDVPLLGPIEIGILSKQGRVQIAVSATRLLRIRRGETPRACLLPRRNSA